MTEALANATPDAKKDGHDFGKAVVDGELRYLSVSQVQTFDVEQDGGCPRKWHFDKVQGVKAPSTKAQDVGTEVHAQIEHYLKTGEDVLGPVARSGRHFIPASGSDLLVEAKFGPRTTLSLEAAGVPFVGFVDLLQARGEYIDELGETRAEGHNVVEALDWKTSSNVERYAKAPSALMRTVQMPGYGELVRQNVEGVERVRLSHVTFQTKGARLAKKSTVLVPVDAIAARWRKVEETVREMIHVARETDVGKVPANAESCKSFGGCPYRAPNLCPRSQKDILRDAFGAKAMIIGGSLQEKLAALRGEGGGR